MTPDIEIAEATREDAAAIAEIHLAARREAMPYLQRPHTDEDVRGYFGRVVGIRPNTWWVARRNGLVVGFLMIEGENLDQLYVDPLHQRSGVGAALLAKAKKLSPRRIVLWTFQRNQRGRSFYIKNGFVAAIMTEGRNDENEPDIQYVWESA